MELKADAHFSLCLPPTFRPLYSAATLLPGTAPLVSKGSVNMQQTTQRRFVSIEHARAHSSNRTTHGNTHPHSQPSHTWCQHRNDTFQF